MPIKPLQICRVKVKLGESRYLRPSVVLAIYDQDDLSLAPISSKLDLYQPSAHFLIPEDHPDFAATGLKVTSYVIGDRLFEEQAAFVQQILGELQGKLAEDFTKWMGL